MAQPLPQELSQVVTNRLMLLLHNIGHLGLVDPMEHKRFERDIATIEKTNADHAHLLRSVLASLDGDLDCAEHWAMNAARLNNSQANRVRLFTLANLGYATRGLRLARESLRAGEPDVSGSFSAAIAVGAFSTVMSVVNATPAASQMLASVANPSIALARRGADALARMGTTEEDLAAVLDVAGEVQREHRLLWLDQQPGIMVLSGDEGDDGAPAVHVSYRVDMSPREAAEVTLQVADRLAQRDIMPVGISVSFVGSQIERVAA